MADAPTTCPYCDSLKTRPLPPIGPSARMKWFFCDGCKRAYPMPRIAPIPAPSEPEYRRG